ITLFYAFQKKILEALDISQVKIFKNDFFKHLEKYNQSLIDDLNKQGELTEEVKLQLDKVIKDFFRTLLPG
ncbi:MAG: hypothetical protein ACYDFR_06770, partial [Candidatus Omnitrophota bacterium]